MAKVTGIDIYKLLPKTNCGDCNFPTCMAFAMQVAAKKAALDQCPHVSAEAQSALGDAQAPPMLTVKVPHTTSIGITADEFKSNQLISVPPRKGSAARMFRLLRIVGQSAAWVTFEVK